MKQFDSGGYSSMAAVAIALDYGDQKAPPLEQGPLRGIAHPVQAEAL